MDRINFYCILRLRDKKHSLLLFLFFFTTNKIYFSYLFYNFLIYFVTKINLDCYMDKKPKKKCPNVIGIFKKSLNLIKINKCVLSKKINKNKNTCLFKEKFNLFYLN